MLRLARGQDRNTLSPASLMNKRFWLWLLLIPSLLLLPRMATAQRQPTRGRNLSANSLKTIDPPTRKQSHHDLPGFDLTNAQDIMAQRLQELRELRQLQDQIQELLRDPDFRNRIKQQLNESDVRQLRDKLLQGKGVSQDRNWQHFLDQAAKRQNWDERQIRMLRAWAERAERKSLLPNNPGLLPGRDPAASPPAPILPPSFSPPPPSLPPLNESEPEPSLLDRMKEESTKWLMDNLDDAGGNVLEALTQMDGRDELSPLADLVRSLRQPDFSGMNLNETSLFPTQQVGSLAHSLSNVGNYLHQQDGVWSEIRSFFRNAPAPSLPHFGRPSISVPASSIPDGEGLLPALLSLLMLGTIVLLLCKSGFRFKSAGSGESAEWRLGPWPVSPSGVSTRQDVIRAFEHLVLLFFGPAAAACHHRRLAERLAEQDGDNPGHRQAAEMLAWLYEQARYAPTEDALSPEQLSDARHALCLLAGVTAP